METANRTTIPASGNEFLDDDLGKQINSLLERYHVPGISVVVVEKGRVSAKVRIS
jgi:hypothetical protein